MTAELVERFTTAWADPTPDRLCEIVEPDVRLVTPMSPTITGREAARKQFARIFELIPDLHGEVTGHTVDGDVVHIDMTLRGTLGGKPIAWDLCDRIRVANGRVAERISYFDPLPLVAAIATRPRAWRAAFNTLRRG